ncbi:M24 family metallopeptidase (plasmid) [Roseibium aggregatum]|uniref:aminopeptidase P family protein n=1 Tax=Roseibium aggregatum TaxID=187304 RepID=UPI001E2C0E95|nr:aminopeptidase P family protein [Roseibium aggregatum]MEC9469114.1 aminopeptidase P family protein [Pseudomonadota bacterium]UES59879.1 M24 family metallopeptidase [Roseibium aggregatum]
MPETTRAAIAGRLTDLRAEMSTRGLNALIVPRFDAHQGEYVAPHDMRLAFVTGFTGSAGVAIVTGDSVRLFVDGRYTVQAQNQCPAGLIDRDHLFENPPEVWLGGVAEPGWSVGYDAMLLPPAWVARFEAAADGVGAELTPVDGNPVDAVWHDQPSEPAGLISAFPLQFAGVSPTDKRAELIKTMEEGGIDLLVDTQPDNISWLLNVRGGDVAFNPMPLSFFLLEREGEGHWFVNAANFEDGLKDTLPGWLTVHPKDAFLKVLNDKLRTGARVLADPDFSPAAVSQAVIAAGAEPVARRSPVTLAKAHKNAAELEGIRACHLQDAVAWVEFSAWLQETVPARAAAGDPVSEYEAEEKILECRKGRPGFLSESFRTISCAGGNAAMCHYAADPKASAPVLPSTCYLMDSGGQYETGTTDATRSYTFGTLPEGYREAYTAVFRALIALATLRFPKGTQGHHIDAICRRPLWDLGLDYDHGTGHGIGHRLSVHEQPQRIGKPQSPVDLACGMVMSIEPGHYKAGHYGIRIENLFEIVEAKDGFLEFANLTWIPIQTDALLLTQLTAAETTWVDRYHAEVEALLEPYCVGETADWLHDACKPLASGRATWRKVG